MITTTNKQKGNNTMDDLLNNTMDDLQRVLNRLDSFRVIDATDRKVVLETPEGNVTASYRIDTLRGNTFPLQVVFHITHKGLNVYTWGSMSNEQNANIIRYFKVKDGGFILTKHKEDKQTEKNIRFLLNL